MLKYILLLILNTVPFFLSCLLYEGGFVISLAFPVIQILINCLNYKWAKKIPAYVFLNVAMLISSIQSLKISTQLYYDNISSDPGTLAVGFLEVQLALVFIIFMTLISIVCKINKNIKLKKITAKAYIFDMDGVLIDSVYSLDQTVRAFLDPLGIDYPENIVEIITPLGYEGAARYIQSLGVDKTVDELTQLMTEGMEKEYVNSIPTKAHVVKTLQALREKGYKLCILSASPHFLIDPCIKRLDIEKYFDFVWSTDDFGLAKSNPQIYSVTAKLLGLCESECAFADDNLTNIKAAKVAGMYTIAVYDLVNAVHTDEMKATADKYIRSFEEF